MRRLACLVLVLGIVFWGTGVRADTTPSRQYTTHDGLPSERVTALAQTTDGLLWIGTQRGLVVYDGHEFRSIAMPDSVQQKQIHALEPMPDGSVWVGVGNNVVQVAPHGAVQRYLLDSHNVVDILWDGERVRFITHLAVWELRAGRDTLSRTSFRYDRLRDVTQVQGAGLGPQGHLWIVNARRGPGRVQPNGRVDFASPPPDGSQTGPFSDLQFMENGTAVVARASHLYRFEPSTGDFTTIADTLAPRIEIHRRSGTTYLTHGSGVLRYSATENRVLKPVGGGRLLSERTPTEVLRDREGGLWVGTRQAGLLHVPAPAVRHVQSIEGHTPRHGMGLEQHGRALWGNTWGDGLYQLRPWRTRATPDGHTAWILLPSRDGRLHGLTSSNEAQGRNWYQWTPAGGWQFVSFAEFAVRGFVDSSGVGYFWHNQGLYRHVPDGDTTRRTRLRSWPLAESQHHLMGPAPNGDIILFDQGHVLRLQRPDGAVIDTIATVPEHATSGGRRLTVDEEGRIWCPFTNLVRIDPETGTAQTLLEGAEVESVKMAGDSIAMAKTDAGLYLLDARTGALRRHLTEADGLLSNDVNGSLLREDTLYVGHPSGLTLLPTDSLFRSPRMPNAVLTGLEVNLNDRSLPGDSLLGEGERAVGFDYTAASLSYPDRVRYEVRLVPRDTSWRTTERRFTRYTNLSPGTYRFEVRARLEGQAPGPVAAYTFSIPPHFYETWWFRLLGVFGLLGLAVGAYRWRVYRLRRRQHELQRAVEKRTQELAEEKQKTERQAEKLAELDEAKNRFFAHISHEFRTPLSLVLGPIRDALNRASDGDAILSENQLRRMASSAERLQRLIGQLLDLATLEAGRMELDRHPGDLASVVERSAEAFRSKAEQKEIDLRIERANGRIETRFDPEKVETIVSNLVGNALKFTPDGGTVVVRVDEIASTAAVDGVDDERVQGTVRVEVEDTGPGIDPDVQEAIFDRFEQVDNSTTREHEGTGLGLALTSQLVELHGGTISVESTPGDGATFTAWFPVVPVATVEGEGPASSRIRADAHGGAEGWEHGGDGAPEWERETEENAGDGAETILVVEDNAEMRAYLREQFAGTWSVIEATDGEEGWQKIRDESPDLILSDVMMPETDGFELCRRVKADEEFRTTPVLLLTARTGEGATREGLRCGADDYVEKPFDVQELKQRIANHLAARRHLQARYREEMEIGATVVGEENHSFVQRLFETIDEHLSNPDLTVKRLAEEMALSRRQLTRRVKEATGEPPGTILRTRRIERAKAMLEAEPETIAEVAYAVGFTSASSFSRSFSDQVGVPPSTYLDRNAS